MAIPGEPGAVEATRTVEYRLAIDFQLNEQVGKLAPLCGSRGSYTGKSAQILDRFDDLPLHEITTRNADTVNTDIDVERRFIHKPRPQAVAPLIDFDDMLQTPIDLKSPIAVQTAKNIRRGQDDRWLQSYYGVGYTGETGATQVAFKSANILAADHSTSGTPTGITKNKLIKLREMMEEALVDLDAEMPIGIITARQASDLLKIVELVSRDYNPAVTMALQNGKPTEFMGFRWVRAEIGNARAYPLSYASTKDGSNHRRVPFFVPSGMHWGSWEDYFARISERADKNHNNQIYARTCGTAVRVHEDKCFQMLCLES